MLDSELSYLAEQIEPIYSSTRPKRRANSGQRRRKIQNVQQAGPTPAILLALLKRIRTKQDQTLLHWQQEETTKSRNKLLGVAQEKLLFSPILSTKECAYFRWMRWIERKRKREFESGDGFRGKLCKRAKWTRQIEKVKESQTKLEAQQEDYERSKVWRQIVRKQIPKVAKQLGQSATAKLSNARRIAGLCSRETRKLTSKATRSSKDIIYRGKRGLREMLSFWKKNEREERELRKRADKEAAERRRLEEEERENRRQAKKLNFLLTQTELYSHFIAKKSGGGGVEKALGGGEKIDDYEHVKDGPLEVGIDFADVDDKVLQAEAKRVALNAVAVQRSKTRKFDNDVGEVKTIANMENEKYASSGTGATIASTTSATTAGSTIGDIDGHEAIDFSIVKDNSTVRKPTILECQLKGYQLKGLGWLANLYEQGINGILADEMGLGKTVQAISLLAHLAESHNIWGPFLVIAPASTLHNWQQEIQRFVPAFKVLPYWGNVNDRKTLRKFWSPKRLYTRDGNFHVLITSYQLVVSDEKHFQRIKWQYMVLDEAQAIKSSGSIRWKILLSFNCRNRLLLTGTPIQNSMQELWALLHFIMPSLFDSHDEFSEWFSRDIESHAENKSSLDAHQLGRLHLILKPFMLRRVKKDVENELGEKVEITVMCDLAPKQQVMYQAIMDKAPMREIMARIDKLASEFGDFGEGIGSAFSTSGGISGAGTGIITSQQSKGAGASDSSLMNIVMQFRKVCNHPDLFGRTEVESPFVFCEPMFNQLPTTSSGSLIWMGSQANPLEYPKQSIWSIEEPKELTSINIQPLSLGPIQTDKEINIPWQFEPDELVPTEIRFLNERLPIAYIPSAVTVAPRISTTMESEEKIQSLDIQRDYSIGRRTRHPDIRRLLWDSGKMAKLDELLVELKANGHRVLIYNQMTRMIDLMEEYLTWRGYTYLRLDGSSRISDRRDLVHDWQTRPDLFIFLLSTRAGGLGINLTAADTVIFYDSDWNPTVDQQAMDRAHRLGQTKQVTVYRLVCRGTVEERIIQRAKQKDEIHRVVIAAGQFQTDSKET